MDKFCSNCGAKLKANQKFCTECGTKVGGKAKKASSKKEDSKVEKNVSNTGPNKGLIIGLIIAGVVVLGLIIGLITKTVYDNSKRTEYKENVTSFKSDLFKSFQDTESVGNQLSINLYVFSATGTHKYARYRSADEAISAALTSKSGEVAKVNSEKPGLERRYEELMDTKVPENKQIKDINKNLKAVYNAYQDVYKAAIKPVGTPTSMRQDYSEARANFTIKYSALNQSLKE